MISYGTFQRGETVVLRLGVDVGSVGDVTGPPVAKLKPIRAGRYTVPGETVRAVAELVVEPAEAEGAVPAGWTVTVPDTVTASLAPGHYVTDLRAPLGTGKWISEPVRFALVEGVSR